MTVKVLIVEDDPNSRKYLKKGLERKTTDFAVTCEHVGNGKEAVDYLEENHETISVILMDIMMPVMDGITAAGIVNEKYDIPIIFLTGSTDTEVREQATEVDFAGYIPKTTSSAMIKNMIEDVLNAVTRQSGLKKKLDGVLSKKIKASKVNWAIGALMQRNGVDSSAAEKNLRHLARSNGLTMEKASDIVISEQSEVMKAPGRSTHILMGIMMERHSWTDDKAYEEIKKMANESSKGVEAYSAKVLSFAD